MAASVPGRGRSHRSAMEDAGVSPGSMTMTLAPFALARLSACHCGGSAAYGLRPTTSAQRVLSISSPLLMASPVIRSLRRPAPAAQVLVHHPVGGAEGAQQQRQRHPAAEVRVAHRTAERRRAVPIAHRQHRLRHLVQRLVPRHPLPPPPTPRPGAFHGIEHPVRMIGQLRQPPDALHAKRPQRRRMFRVGSTPASRGRPPP